jgi:hypothetical protein
MKALSGMLIGCFSKIFFITSCLRVKRTASAHAFF